MSAPWKVILPASADRAEWLAKRRQGIGSSDIPNLMGVGYSTALHVYHDKRGDLPGDDDAGEAALWGTLHEDTIAREWARRNRTVVRRVGLIARTDAPWQMCTLDRRCTECPLDRDRREQCAVEIKTRSAFKGGQWRRDVPDDVLAQTLWQLHVLGYDHLHVAVLIGGNDYRQTVVRRAGNEQLIEDIVAVATQMNDRIAQGDPPLPTPEDRPDRLVELYAQLHPNRDGVLYLDDDPRLSVDVTETLLEYETGRLKESAGKKDKERAKAELLRLLGPASIAAVHGEMVYAFEPTTGRPKVDLDVLAEKHPQAYAECVTQKTGRRLTIAQSQRLAPEVADVDAA